MSVAVAGAAQVVETAAKVVENVTENAVKAVETVISAVENPEKSEGNWIYLVGGVILIAGVIYFLNKKKSENQPVAAPQPMRRAPSYISG